MPEVQMDQVTQLLQQWVRGDEKALGILVPLVYQELRRLAHHHLKSERVDQVLPDMTGRYGEAISSHFGCEFMWPRQLTLLTSDQSSAAVIHIWESCP